MFQYLTKTTLLAVAFLLLPSATQAATEFISTISPTGDYYTLSSWEAAVQTDLTAATTRVFSGSVTGTLSQGDTVTVVSATGFNGATATVVDTTSDQILIQSASMDTIILNDGDTLEKDASNYWTVSGTGDQLGDSAIAVAECYKGDYSAVGTGGVNYIDDEVLIDGWITNSTNYVKVYTPESERHDGTLKDGSGDYTGFAIMPQLADVPALDNSVAHTKMSGLIIDGVNASNDRAIGIENTNSNLDVGQDVYITNNIIANCNETSGDDAAIATYVAPTVLINNIVMDSNRGIIARRPREGTILYNNTVINSVTGIFVDTPDSWNNIILRNNLVNNSSTSDYNIGTSGTIVFNYNASSDSTADDFGGTGNRVNQIFSFVDEAGDDFHLASDDTAAKDNGADLSGDPNYAFSTDIDGGTRTSPWDIGADEHKEVTHLIRKDYTIDTISRSSDTVTVNLTSAHSNLQTGQRIKISGVTDSTFDGHFTITGVNSTTQFTYTQTGSDASSTGGTAGGDYATLSGWEADQQRDLVTADQIEVAECYNDWPSGLSDAVTISDWTTGVNNYVKIYAPESERHDGTVFDDSGNYTGFALRKGGDWTYLINLNTDNMHAKFIGIITDNVSPGGGNKGITLKSSGDASGEIRSCIAINAVIGFSLSNPDDIVAVNSFAYNNTNGFAVGSWEHARFYNCTAVNNSGYGFMSDNEGGDSIGRNLLASGNGTDFQQNDNWDLSYSASSDGTADDFGGTGNRVNQIFSFVDEANDDFHLSGSDTAARNQGTDLSSDPNYAFSTDIDGDSRPLGSTWDIGADETPDKTTQSNSTSENFMTDGLVGYWSFDGSAMDWSQTGAEVRDLSGNANHGAVQNFTTSAMTIGKQGQAIDFDGSDDFVGLDNPSNLDAGFTVSLWIKSDNIGNMDITIGDYDATQGDEGWAIRFPDGAFGFSHGGSGGFQNQKFAATNSDDGEWHHLAVVVNDDATGAIGYHDLTEYSISFSADKLDKSSLNLIIGDGRNSSGDPYGNSYQGKIDDVRIYNRALSESEIGKLYRHGARKLQVNSQTNQTLTSGLVGHWTFDGQDMDWSATGAEVRDTSGNANHGAVQNFTTSAMTIGKQGQAIEFDGSDDFVGTGITDNYQTGDFSVSAWIKVEDLSVDGGRIVHDDVNKDGWALSYGDLQSPGRIRFFVRGSGNIIADANGVIDSTDVWYNVIAVKQGDTGYVYVNKVEEDTDSGSSFSSASGEIQIGGSTGAGNFFNGKIDDVRIYNRALSESEIQKLYRMGNRKFEIRK